MNEEVPRKVCRKCGEEKPLTLDYWRKRSNGFWNQPCLVCHEARQLELAEYKRAYNNTYYAANREREIARARAWYEANPEKTRAWRQANAEKLNERRQRWRTANLEKAREGVRAWRRANPDHEKNWRAARRDKESARKRAWRIANIERERAYSRAWTQANPEKAQSHVRNRRARLMGLKGTHTGADIRRLYEEQEHRCAYCGITLYWHIPYEVHVDHIVPVSRGGANSPDNLAIACQHCNKSKGSKTLEEWMKTRGW